MNKIKFSESTIKRLVSLGVEIIYLFGSRASNTENLKSDVDLGIVFNNKLLLKDSLILYKELYRIFSNTPSIMSDAELDIILMQQSPIFLQFEIINTGKILFERSSRFRANYEEYIIKQYIDMKPMLDEFEYVTLKSFS